MTVTLKENRIYHFNENLKIKEHFAFSTKFACFEILNDGRLLVMEDYYNYKNEEKSNLYCINQQIEIEWFAETFTIENRLDQFTGFSIHGKSIFANTWNCFRHEIDIRNGKILSSLFTK
jgi:hypothetical protein